MIIILKKGFELCDLKFSFHPHHIRIQNLDKALLATGFSFPTSEYVDPWLKIFHALLPKTSGIHRSGATSLDLAHVASGRFDGFWDMSLKPWDITAGVILVREAGGYDSHFDNLSYKFNQKHAIKLESGLSYHNQTSYYGTTSYKGDQTNYNINIAHIGLCFN